ncbi:DUF421 domain-containing protein [Georgenia sunbinii]|uniref:DUF421 domain-containing protein n=1 Tax=Georgenia sunbinii TaxID=3117728 RepID=UPI002F264AB0
MEIVLRAVVIFFFLWAVTRIAGRSTLGEMSTFELILFVTMGDLVQQAVTQQDYSITGAVLAVGTFTALTVTLSWVNSRWKKTHRVLHGTPVVVFANGEPKLDVMRRERLSMDDFVSAARQDGIETFGEIKVAVLEANGQMSFMTTEKSA